MQYSSSSTNQKAGGSNQSRHKFPLLPTVHKMKLLRPHGPLMWTSEDLKHVDLSLTGQTSYHSKAIFYLHKYMYFCHFAVVLILLSSTHFSIWLGFSPRGTLTFVAFVSLIAASTLNPFSLLSSCRTQLCHSVISFLTALPKQPFSLL